MNLCKYRAPLHLPGDYCEYVARGGIFMFQAQAECLSLGMSGVGGSRETSSGACHTKCTPDSANELIEKEMPSARVPRWVFYKFRSLLSVWGVEKWLMEEKCLYPPHRGDICRDSCLLSA